MADTKELLPQLIEALEKRGVSKDAIEEAVRNLRVHKVNHIYWNEADKEWIVLHVFNLARTRSLLQNCLATDSNSVGQQIIQQHIREIDEHFNTYHWPTDVSEDEPVLLKELWQQQKISISAANQLPNDATRAARISVLRNESNRILRTVLKLPTPASAQGEFESAATPELAAALRRETDRFVRAVIEDELHTRYPAAYDFLAAVYPGRHVNRLNCLLNLKTLSSQGFSQSMTHHHDALTALIDNLTIARGALGQQHFTSITGTWDTLDKIRLVAVLDLHSSGVNLGGYHLAYPVEYTQSQMAPWMDSNSAGELKSEGVCDAGVYILLSELTKNAAFNAGAKKSLHARYIDIQNNLIKPNYDALQLIVAHSDKMTKYTAQTIVSLLGKMVDSYRQVVPPVEGDSVLEQYRMVLQELDRSWNGLSQSEELPPFLRNKITHISKSALNDIDSVHSFIRFLHNKANRALERQMTVARADMTITVGRIGDDRTEDIQIARLDDAPIIVQGLIRHRVVGAIVRAARRLPGPVAGTFVLVNNHITYSVRLGEHRVELSANIERPDNEGFVRLECYQGGIEVGQQLRGAFVGRVLKEAGLTVTCDQDGLVGSLVIGILDKDHGARTDTQIEEALILVLRLIWSLRDLDHAMAYLFLNEVLSGDREGKITADKINEFAVSIARMFVVEGMIPFSYRGQGMPFDTYCQYSGPSVLREFRAYASDERQMIRHRLYFTLNALLQTFDLPIIQPGTGGVGQEVIDKYFNGPLRNALGRGELRINVRGLLERNPSYQPLKEIIRKVVVHEDEALRIAVLLKVTDCLLDFTVIGSIDQLTLVSAQQELEPNKWLVIYGLADDDNRAILYAFARYSTPQGGWEWLSVGGLKTILRNSGYSVPNTVQVPAFRKLVSHRLLIEQARKKSIFGGTSVRALSASVGDGSVRIGRVTFDRDYWLNPKTRDGRVLLVPFTTPEDIEAIRNAEAVLVTSGGLLSHAGVTTRELAIPALILPRAEWVQSSEGVIVRLDERHPGIARKTDQGFWVSDSMVSQSVDVHEGDMVLVSASQGIVSILPVAGQHFEQAQEFIHDILSGDKTSADLEHWLAAPPSVMNGHHGREQIISDTLALVLAEALWNKRLRPAARKQLIDVVQHARTGVRVDGSPAELPQKSAAYINLLLQTVSENVFTELEGLLSEVEHKLSTLSVFWRALNLIVVVEHLWAQVKVLSDSLNLTDPRLQAFEGRIDFLRRHPRIALLRTSALHEVESLSERPLTEADLPLIRQTLRRLGHGVSGISTQKILLVCTANIDRSPMAEFLLKNMLFKEGVSGVEVFSRGVAALENQPMSEIGQTLLLSEEGISASGHRSRRLEERDIREADIILAMEQFHLQLLTTNYPSAAGKMFLLNTYGRVQDIGDIEDPAGQPTDAYYRMKRKVQLAMSGAFKRLREDGLFAKAMVADLQAKADELTRAKRKRIGESQRAVVPLEDVDADSVELVGGKGANLGEITQIVKRLGAQVPPALMVTTFAFERFLEENAIRETYVRMTAAIDTLLTREILDEGRRKHILDASEQIRDLILQGNLDVAAGVGREIMDAVDTYGLGHRCLSVRSSGLQEDTEEAAFAGAAETYLCINPAELLDWIKKVWASFWLTRGILYRSDRIVRQGPVKLAIVVQQMVDSEVSGVIFTTDPVSGRDVIVIEAGYGLGEGVVSGLVDVDRYYVDKFDGSVTDIHVGKKAFMVKQHPSGKGTSIVPVENDLRDIPCLKEEDVRANIAMALEEHYALPQDIEFGMANGKVSVLQTRPVTTRVK